MKPTSPAALCRALVLCAVASLPPAAAGCHFWNQLWGKDTVDLEKADVASMSVDIRKERKTICPREQVQMAVFADIMLDGDKDKRSFETWAGRGNVNKNDKLDFPEFAFHSEQGKFDDEGWFAPNTDVLSTVDREYEIKTVFKRRPDKFSFSTKYKPDYQCIKGGGKSGQAGSDGSAGSGGQSGGSGSSGSSSSPGGSGSSGGPGGPGGDGGNGGAGPHVVAYATMVKTAYYDKLVAIRISGDLDDFLLAPVDQPIVLRANGGPGGAGGAGGHGGQGGSGASGNPGGRGGDGAGGGSGGKGGTGGPGGSIDLIFDARFGDLGNSIKLDVSGGAAGEAGPPGSGGGGGSGGSGMTPSGAAQSAPSGQRGNDGPRGGSAAAGQRGPDGHASSHAGKVGDRFAGVAGVTPLDAGGSAVASDAPATDKPAKGTKGKPTAKPAAATAKKQKSGSSP